MKGKAKVVMHKVESSAVAEIGHHGADTLRVTYKGGVPYDFPGSCSPEQFAILNDPKKTKSVGRALLAMKLTGGVRITEHHHH